ncbi:MAG: hypothetical protein K0R34_2938 [Herbinix sp.]|jgi:hypothetical protein|nr:hypothetical protein [Herbinix sp.]
MKFFKGLITFLLIIIIVGGVGFLAYNLYFVNLMPGSGMNMSSDNMGNTTNNNNNNEDSSDMTDMDMSSGNMNQTVAIPNPEDGKNREKLNEAITLINKAMDQITIDPYSQATITEDPGMQMNGSMGTQVTGTINIYPSDNSSVNITPNEAPQEAETSQPAMAGMNMDESTKDSEKTNHVYDQMKLQQLHSGIYTIAQGLSAIDILNDNLLGQSMILEQQPFTYQTYVQRYNNALMNKAELEKAISLLESASILINVNPYASDNGYTIDSDSMNQLHEGVYQFAQGMAMLESLEQDFINQMTSASMNAQNSVSIMGQMNMSSNSSSLLGGLSISTIINIILIVLIIGLIIGVLGSILNLFKHKTPTNS